MPLRGGIALRNETVTDLQASLRRRSLLVGFERRQRKLFERVCFNPPTPGYQVAHMASADVRALLLPKPGPFGSYPKRQVKDTKS